MTPDQQDLFDRVIPSSSECLTKFAALWDETFPGSPPGVREIWHSAYIAGYIASQNELSQLVTSTYDMVDAIKKAKEKT